MIKRLTFSGILLLFFLNISNAQETPTSLMEDISYVYMEKLIAVARENYPRVKALDDRISIAQLSIKSAQVGWLNPVSVSYVYSPSTSVNLANPSAFNFFSGYQIAFSLNLGAIFQTPISIKRTKEELNIAKYDKEEYLASLASNVKVRYTSYLQALKVLKLNSQASLDARDVYTLTKYKYERGELTLSDFVTASSALTTSSQAKIDSEVAVLHAKFALEELLGIKLEEVPN